MKKLLAATILCAGFGGVALANEINLGNVEKQKIVYPDVKAKPKETLVLKNDQSVQKIVEYQKEKDIEDIENLWTGTVENNRVIGFALKKLASPESTKRIHSSLMAKTMSAMVAGASFVPMMTGGSYLTQTSAFAAGRAAQNLINKNNIIKETPLTDTELIELASLVETLQDDIIGTYYSYKSALIQLKETRTKMLLYNKNYSKALQDKDVLEIAVSSSLYDNMRVEEFEYMEEAKKYHLELQRLAGKKVVDKLNLYQFNYNAALMQEAGGK